MANFNDNFKDLEELGIDCNSDDLLTKNFNKAANHLQSLLPNVDNETLLVLYGYYKQGSEGKCNIPRPSWYDMRGKAKWDSWNNLGNMESDEAKDLYIKKIKELDPNFEENSKDVSNNESWVKVSTLQNQEDFDKNITDYIKEGQLKEVRDYLNSQNLPDINRLDEDGLALIHWSADSGFVDVLEALISSGADVNLQDQDGQTALHYASSCGHVDCIKLLLNYGARLDIRDNENCCPISVASDDSIKELLTNQ